MKRRGKEIMTPRSNQSGWMCVCVGGVCVCVCVWCVWCVCGVCVCADERACMSKGERESVSVLEQLI